MFKVYDDVRVEPTDVSFKAAADFAKANKFDAILAVGGGSVIDTGMTIQETVAFWTLPLYVHLIHFLIMFWIQRYFEREFKWTFQGPSLTW